MSAVLDAFEQLLDAQEERLGYRPLASCGAVTNKDCIPSDVPSDHAPVAGGFAETGTMQIQVRQSDFPTPHERADTVICEGKTLTLLSFTSTGGVTILTAGDSTAEVES